LVLTTTIKDKTKANAIFDTLKKAYESNNLDKVKELVNDLKTGIAFAEDFTEIAIDSLTQLFDRLKSKYESLRSQLEELTKDKRFIVMQEDAAFIENHFQQEEKLLKAISERLNSQLAKI
jgi:prefoldin subunit 5